MIVQGPCHYFLKFVITGSVFTHAAGTFIEKRSLNQTKRSLEGDFKDKSSAALEMDESPFFD